MASVTHRLLLILKEFMSHKAAPKRILIPFFFTQQTCPSNFMRNIA